MSVKKTNSSFLQLLRLAPKPVALIGLLTLYKQRRLLLKKPRPTPSLRSVRGQLFRPVFQARNAALDEQCQISTAPYLLKVVKP